MTPPTDTLREPEPLPIDTNSPPDPINPLDQEQADYEKSVEEWRQKTIRDVDKAALSPDEFYKDADLGFARDPKEARMLLTNDGFLDLMSDGNPVPADKMSRDLFRQQVAIDQFGGEGADSEESFNAQIVKAATGRKQASELFSELGMEAARAATIESIGESATSFQAWREQAKTKPGYKPGNDADYLEAWNEARQASKDLIEPYRDELSQVFQGWKESTGAGKATSVMTGILSDLLPDGGLNEGEASETAKAVGRKSTRQTAWEVYDKLSPEDRPQFMQALGVVAANVPKEERPKFFANIAKQSGRDLESLAQGAVTGAVTLGQSGGTVGWEDFIGSNEALAARKENEAATREKFRRQSDFVQEVQKMQEGAYDPLKYLGEEGSWQRRGEKIAYGTTGVLATSIAASNPYTAPALFSSLTESHYQSIKDSQMKQGASYEDASRFATEAAPYGAAVETLSEFLGSNLLRGKLPFADKMLTGLMDKIGNTALRAGVRVAAGGVEQGIQEVAQNYIDPAMEELGHYMGNAKYGAGKVSFAENVDSFASVFPLALMGIPGAFGREARINAFIEAKDVQILAAGGRAADVAKFRQDAAKGKESASISIDAMVANFDPSSDSAKAASAQIAEEAKAQRAAVETAQATGLLPKIVQTADGKHSVIDMETGEVVGMADNPAQAMRISSEHTAALHEKRADVVAYMATMLEAGQESLAMDPTGKAQNSFELGTRYDELTAAAENPASIDQFQRQAAIDEQINGGNGDVSRVALGRNIGELRGQVRTFTNRLFQGASVTTIVHEMGHGMLRELEASGVIVRDEKVAFVKAVNEVMKGKVMKDRTINGKTIKGQALALLPDGVADADLTDDMLNEAISHILEAEVLRTRKRTKSDKAVQLSPGVISRNLTALSRLAPGATKKFRAFIEAARQVFGLSSARALAMKKGFREGKFDMTNYEAFLDKLTGRDLQAEHDGIVRDEQSAIVGEDVIDENNPFSIGRATVTPTAETRYFEGAEGSMSVIGPAPFSLSNEYGGYHRPAEDGPRAHDLLEQEMVPSDVYDRPDLYSGMSRKVISQTMAQLKAVRGKAEAILTIYRAGPKPEINTGDWVSLSQEYARTHADAQDPDGFKVWASKVKAQDVRWAIDDLAEFGYFGEPVEAIDSGSPFSLSAYHGTPHKVDKFSTNKIGTGEGAQAYGWGLYFAQNEKVARNYRDVLSRNYDLRPNRFFNPYQHPRKLASGAWIVETNGKGNAHFKTKREAVAFKAAKDEEYASLNDPKPKGNLYTVTLDVNDEDLLDWDKPLREQSEKVKVAILTQMPAKSWEVMEGKTGQIYYQSYWQGGYASTGDIEGASRSIAKLGIRGIRYLDGNSRNDGEGSYNYVIFDDSKIKITEENGKAVDLGASPFSLAPSPITPAMDADYLSAVESGDMEAAQRMVDEAVFMKIPRESLPVKNDIPDFIGMEPVSSDSGGGEANTYKSGGRFVKDYRGKLEGFGMWKDRGVYKSRPATRDEFLVRVALHNKFFPASKITIMAITEDGAVTGQGNLEGDQFETDDVRGILKEKGWNHIGSDSFQHISGIIMHDADYNGATTYQENMETGEMEAVAWEPFDVLLIPSADPVTYDEEGNIIPLSQRFDETKNSINYSLAPSSFVDSMSVNVASRMANPKARMAIFTRLLSKLADLKRDRDEVGVAFGKDFTRKAIEDPRGLAVIRNDYALRKEMERERIEQDANLLSPDAVRSETARRTAMRRAELEDEAHAKHGGILDQADLVKLKEQPVHSYLSDPDSPMRGQLMSLSQATSRGVNFFDPSKQGDYDGAGNASRSVFGGSLAPDQAAQELFDEGLIKDPTPDAMWQALEKEAASVAKMKEYMKAAKVDVAAAKVQAREEIQTWARDQRIKRQEMEEAQSVSDAEIDGEMQEEIKWEKANYSPKARLLRALAMLDAIISVLPVAERGRIGGYTQLAKLGTDEARLKFLNERIAKVDEVVNDYLGKEYRKTLEKIIERSKPKNDGKGGKKRTGKLGHEAHDFFSKVELVMALADAEVDAATTKLEKKLANKDEKGNDLDPLSEQEQADLFEEWQILNMFGSFDENTLLEKSDAIALAQEVYDAGRNQWRMKEEARLADVKAGISDAKEEVGNGDAVDLQNSKAKRKGMVGSVVEMRWSGRSMREVIESFFGKDSKTAKRFVRPLRKAFQARTAEMIRLEKAWGEQIEKATGKTGRAARLQVFEMQTEQAIHLMVKPEFTETIKVPIATFFDAEKQSSLGLSKIEIAQLTEQFEDLPDKSNVKYLTLKRALTGEKYNGRMMGMTEAEGIHISMLWAQEGYKKGLTKHGYGEDFQQELESKLSPAAKALREFLADYYRDSFPDTAKLYREMFGVNLRQIENYAPGTFWFTGAEDTSIDPSAGIVSGGSFKQGMGSSGAFSQGSHKQRTSHTAAPKLRNAFDVFFSHANQSIHWKHLAGISRELNGVFGNPELKVAMEARNPEAASALRDFMKVIENNGVQLKAPGKFIQFLLEGQAYMAMAYKASTAIKNALGGALNQAYAIPPTELLRGFGRLASGKLELSPILNSEIIQNKLNGGNSPELRAAISKSLRAKPTRRGDFLLAGMEIHATADAYGNVVGAAIAYDYHLRQTKEQNPNMSEGQAMAIAWDMTEDSINRLSQPSEVIDRSLAELNSNWLGKLMFLYRSEARQKSSLYITAMENVVTGKMTAEDFRVIFIAHLVMAPLMKAVSAALSDAMDPSDDEWFDEKNWSPYDFLIAAATGPLSGIMLLGDVFSSFTGTNSPLANYVKAGKSAVDIFTDKPKGDKLEWYSSKINNVLHGVGAFPGVVTNIAKQAVGTARNAIPR